MKNLWVYTFIIIAFDLGVIIHSQYGNVIRKNNALIEECEKELPRNQYCSLVAKPNKEIK